MVGLAATWSSNCRLVRTPIPSGGWAFSYGAYGRAVAGQVERRTDTMHQSTKNRTTQLVKIFLLSGALSYSVVGLNVSSLVGFESATAIAMAAESASDGSSTTSQNRVQQQTDRNLSRRSLIGSTTTSPTPNVKGPTSSPRQGRKLIRRPSAGQLVPTAPVASSGTALDQGAPMTSSGSSTTTSNSSTTGQKEGSAVTSSSGTTKNMASGTGSISISTVTSSAVSGPTTSSPGAGSSANLSSAASASTATSASGSSSSGNSFAGRALQKLLSQMPALADILSPHSSATPNSTPPSSTSPVIGRAPASLAFSAVQNGSNPAGQTVAISNTGSGTLNWIAVSNASWLSLNGANSVSGTNSGSFTANVNPSGLAVGNYNASITISATGATNTPQTVSATLTVTAAPTPTIGLSTTALSFTGVQGGTNPASQSVTITNSGSGTLSWSVSDNVNWLSLSPTSGTGNGSVTASVNISGLAAGTYNGTITISATGATNTPQTVSVMLTVSAAPTPTIGLSPTSLSFTATQGAANPAAQTVNVTNPGSGTLTWSASDNASWLTLNTTSGTTTTETDPITVSVNTSGLSAGTYNATITISASGATNTPRTVPVTLTVSAPSTTSATLTWNANTESDLAGYKVYRATASGAYGAPIATLQGNVTSYVATGLQSGTTYYFVVTAYDLAGNESAHSNEVSKSIF